MVTRLRRTLGLTGLTFYGVGIIVGAGVYSVIGAAAGLAGDALWLSFAVGAVVALLTGLSYAELATAYPEAGAEYVYVRRAAPKRGWLAFGIGALIVVAGTATAATVALAFAGYLGLFLSLPPFLIAAMLLAAATALNIVGIQHSSWVNIVFTSVEVGGLLVVVGIGMSAPGFGAAVLAAPPPTVWSAAALIFFVYLGFEEIANLAEEARDPGRDIPRAILLSLGLTTLLYVLVALAVVALVPPEELANSDSPLATALAGTSPAFVDLLGAIALFATANTVLITLIASSRMVLAMARTRDLPMQLAAVLPGRRTPWAAALVCAVLAAALLPLGDIAVVAGVSSLGSLIAFAAVNVALIVLRSRDARRARPFRVPLEIRRVPVPAVAAVAAIGLLVTQFDPIVYVVTLGALGAALVIHAIRRRWRHSDDGGRAKRPGRPK